MLLSISLRSVPAHTGCRHRRDACPWHNCGATNGTNRACRCRTLAQRPAVCLDGGLGVSAGGEVREEGVGVSSDALESARLRCGRAALAASAHGGEIGESGLAWHG